MDKKAFKYLGSYSTDAIKINRLLVSAFLTLNRIEKVENSLIRKYKIEKKDSDLLMLHAFLEFGSPRTLEDLIEAFEYVISPGDKIVTGAVYTPEAIRKYIVNEALKSGANNITICDPACGCSGFLLTAAKEIKKITGQSYKHIFEHSLFGLDIHDYSIERSKLLLSLLALQEGEDPLNIEFRLYTGNALNFDWEIAISGFKGFSAVVGNPPYVASRNIDDKSRSYLAKWSVCQSGHPDLYIPFFQIGLYWLKSGGILGYITMNTFFKSLNGRALREFLQTSSFRMKILDFGSTQVFRSKSTYTCICFIHKSSSKNLEYKKVNTTSALIHGLNGFNSIPYLNLKPQNGWNLQNPELISKIESVGKPFSELFTTRNGIATLKNEIYIFKPVREDKKFYHLEKNKVIYKIEKEICKEIVNANYFTKANSIRGLKEKIIFPYDYHEGLPYLIEEKLFEKKYPEAYSYLKSQKTELSTRDKGKGGEYGCWYAFGRNQSLDKFKYKLFFPHISSGIPNYILNKDENLLFVNGLAVVSDNLKDLKFLSKLLSTKLFWFYIINTSKPYGSGFYSLSKNYIKNFGVYDFSEEEKDKIIKESNLKMLNAFVEHKYDVRISLQP